ncbi:proteasome regulatory particle subunit [Ophidiomyces ophidiicola]|uniref:proteasome regulatory particle subunit n=1 Tax=Ophidiomyces ophidiicola TaxID=1387563 RepID=UPI0020C2CB3A|nr:proteasome regulatory particle subunit [Ophidiomyces ophidiicola]KAI1941541.1 proteasome regulatory particle subunit [Ophidiomyces ophidiicola]KAI2051306.1 proteasome regulatory particle subunit [Ophidiomyces ophidiicola]KAI2084742.1 proteasome regulatory particle subunit [Ophidiomyces ophidiicola]
MGSDPQYAKYPDLTLSQDVFNLANSACPAAVRESSLKRLQSVIEKNHMAPLYRHLAHPVDGIFNSSGETSPQHSTNQNKQQIVCDMLPHARNNVSVGFPWDERLYEKLLAENKKELDALQKEEDDAAEAAGDTEVQAARGKRAEFWARVGDKEKAITAYEAVFENTGVLGTKIDIVLAMIRIGLFFGDKIFVKKHIERANSLVEGGGDWDRRNRLKAYKGLHLLTTRSYKLAAPLLLDSLSTFTSYELCSYSSLVIYAVIAGSLSLKRVDFKAKVVDAPEIKAILGEGEERLSALSGAISSGPGAGDEEMKDISTGASGQTATVVNLTTLGTGTGIETENEVPVDFSPLANLVSSLYSGIYRTFFTALAAVEDNFVTQDRYLHEHRSRFVREMRLRGYQQLLQSYRIVGLASMAKEFGVTVDFLDKDLAKFIAGDRISCTIDRVNGVIETNRPDDKNKQYADVVKQGDALITKLQKYGQAVRLRGNTARSTPLDARALRNYSHGKTSSPPAGRLHKGNINPNVLAAQYAVRGELAVKAEEYRVKLEQGAQLPFDNVIFANIGNPQQLDQKPITFFRQVLSILEYPDLLRKEDILRSALGFKQDAIDRARHLLKDVRSIGAYTQSQGSPAVRQSISAFIEKRDGFPADPSHIYLSAGASSGVNTLLSILCADRNSGVLVPIPQYPLYTATLSLLNARCVPYYLDEGKGWGLDVDGIRASVAKAKAEGTDVRAIVIINPGNPTGACLGADVIKQVIDLAVEEKLVIMADEVYQTNVFQGDFVSFKKRLRQLQRESERYSHVELASLHSVSKGMVGECGHRGGYFELVGFHADVEEQIYKFISVMLCPPVIGQCLVELMVNPPKTGDPSYEVYQKEYNAISVGLRQRAFALYEAFKLMEGVECQEPQVWPSTVVFELFLLTVSQGSMYLFPSITLPPKALAAAKAANRQADEFYALRLLDATGVCIVPGSGFGQKPGTFHFRTTFLAPGTEWVSRIVDFHKGFMDEFR